MPTKRTRSNHRNKPVRVSAVRNVPITLTTELLAALKLAPDDIKGDCLYYELYDGDGKLAQTGCVSQHCPKPPQGRCEIVAGEKRCKCLSSV